MFSLFRKGWDVVVAVVGGEPEQGYLDGVYVAGKKRDRRTIRVRDTGHPPELVQAVLDDMAGTLSEGSKIPLHGYRGGEIPTYYALSADLEVLQEG